MAARARALRLEAIDACGKAGQPYLAVQLLERMETPDLVAITSVVNAFARLGKALEAARWLEEAQRLGLKPNRITFNGVIQACARVAQVKEAIEWLERMEALRVQPDLCSYTAVLDAFAKRLKSSIEQLFFHSGRAGLCGRHRNGSIGWPRSTCQMQRPSHPCAL